jgi:hypothetical protein
LAIFKRAHGDGRITRVEGLGLSGSFDRCCRWVIQLTVDHSGYAVT